jgi:hypothetical protein
MRSPLPLLLALLAAGCASAAAAPREDPAAPARAADDAALAAAAADLGPLEDHYVAVAGGRFLGGAMLLEDAASLLAGEGSHAYLFVQGSQGERRVPIPALYGPRIAGNGLMEALGLKSSYDPTSFSVVVTSGDRSRAFPMGGGAATAWFTVAPASGLAPPVEVEFVLSPGFAGTAVVATEDADAAGLRLSEVPGTAVITELLTGRTVPCRRALARITLEGFDGEPDTKVSAVVEVLFPR